MAYGFHSFRRGQNFEGGLLRSSTMAGLVEVVPCFSIGSACVVVLDTACVHALGGLLRHDVYPLVALRSIPCACELSNVYFSESGFLGDYKFRKASKYSF